MTLESTFEALIKKINEKQCKICVLGLGQVGLPTALTFLKLGFQVIGYDSNAELIMDLKRGKSRIPEKGFNELILQFIQNKSFIVTTESDILLQADVIIICVPTPLDNSGNADMQYLMRAIGTIAKYLDNEKLIVIESTIPPRTMIDFVIPNMERLSGKKAGVHFLISFCPERIAPGNALHEFTNNARIIGANDNLSYLASQYLYKDITKGGIYHTDTTTAEVSKLAENSYRDTNIAFANELAMICEQLHIDVMDVIRLANTHPRVNIHRPGPGVGGPCLPKDPYLLLSGINLKKISIVKTARSINDSMPHHIVEILMNAKSKTSVAKGNVLILGASYKPDVNDARYSPTEGIISALKEEGFTNISVHDPYSKETFGAKVCKDLYAEVRVADYVIIATGHSMYKSLDIKDFKADSIIIDAVRIFDKEKFLAAKLAYLTIGSS